MTTASNSSVEEKYVHHGFRFALSLTNDRYEAEDLVQQACLKIIAKKGRISTRGYLLTTIRNLFYDKMRRQKLIAFESLHGMESSIPAVSRTRTGVKLDLEASLKRLSVEEREVIFLNCVEGYTAAEIAPMLSKPRSTILNVLSRAKAKLLAQDELDTKEIYQKGGRYE